MATKKQVVVQEKEVLDFDINTFKKQKEQLKRVASAEVAQRVEVIKGLLEEIREFVEVAGLDIKLGGGYGSLTSAIEAVDEHSADWNSSSYDC